MNDCPNAEMRDQLPDLLHGRLDEATLAVVAAHVQSCVDCHEELELLRSVLALANTRTPMVDVAAIVRALPSPPKVVLMAETQSTSNVPATHTPTLSESTREAKVVPIAPRRRVWSDWRVAAAITLLVAGGSSGVLLNRGPNQAGSSAGAQPPVAVQGVAPTNTAAPLGTSVAQANTAASSVATTTPVTPSTQATVAQVEDHANTDMGSGGRLGDLNEQQLQSLLNKIDNLPAVPVSEPEPVSLHVNSQSSSEGA